MHQAGGDPKADLQSEAPQAVGRFDLRGETLLPSLATGAAARSGTWDVLVHPNGRVYFTSFYDPSGSIEIATGAVARFESAGTGLNELALLPDGRIAATRYGASGGGDGSIVVLSAAGEIEVELPLDATPGFTIAAKSIAFDPTARQFWVNTDLIASADGRTSHDARIIDLATGAERARFETPELQFPSFGADGRGYFAWLDDRRLVLQITDPGQATGPDAGQSVLLDAAFGAGVDFVQDVRPQRDGRVVVTRWSGAVHVVGPEGRVETIELPRPGDGGIYYSAVAVGDRVCATYCGGIRIACGSL